MEEQSVWRRRRRRSNGRAVMRFESDAFSDCTVLAAIPVNHDYNGEERWAHWCRKSSGDNYNAWDKIMGTHCTLPIISCIRRRLTHPPPLIPPLTTSNHRSYLWNLKWINLMTGFGRGLRSISVSARVWLSARFCQMSKNIYHSLPPVGVNPRLHGIIVVRTKRTEHVHSSVSRVSVVSQTAANED